MAPLGAARGMSSQGAHNVGSDVRHVEHHPVTMMVTEAGQQAGP
jgi:hypothetical protein